ncbi:MAG TPA: hypothetical protein VFJ15_00215 [Oleiagrimonas sp.]|nr:hypothetical protein [Oleiagrimonas sp.]
MAAFLASTVEFIEALTVVLAVGTVRGWRGTLLGSGAAVGVLLLVVALLGSALTRIPLDAIRVVVGTLLLLFGLRWLHKAILRGAGVIARHDEAKIYTREQQALRGMTGNADGWDKVAFALAFKSVLLEGTEVVFIVLALAAGGAGLLWPASIGALAALAVVGLLGFAIHRPLSRIPENTLKFVVGVLLSAFGTFWTGEGLGVLWPGGDWAIGGLVAGYLIVACVAVALCRQRFGAVSHARMGNES